MQDKYYIKSSITGKYLTNLFEDEHNKLFQSTNKNNAYYYNNLLVARDVARQLKHCEVIYE